MAASVLCTETCLAEYDSSSAPCTRLLVRSNTSDLNYWTTNGRKHMTLIQAIEQSRAKAKETGNSFLIYRWWQGYGWRFFDGKEYTVGHACVARYTVDPSGTVTPVPSDDELCDDIDVAIADLAFELHRRVCATCKEAVVTCTDLALFAQLLCNDGRRFYQMQQQVVLGVDLAAPDGERTVRALVTVEDGEVRLVDEVQL